MRTALQFGAGRAFLGRVERISFRKVIMSTDTFYSLSGVWKIEGFDDWRENEIFLEEEKTSEAKNATRLISGRTEVIPKVGEVLFFDISGNNLGHIAAFGFYQNKKTRLAFRGKFVDADNLKGELSEKAEGEELDKGKIGVTLRRK